MALYYDIRAYTQAKVNAMKKSEEDSERLYASVMGQALADAVADNKNVDVKVSGKQVVVSIDGDSGGERVIDLKPHFARGPKVRKTLDGTGWYQIVPIRRYTSRSAPMREQARGMSSRLYKELLSKPLEKRFTDIITNNLYDNKTITSPNIPELNYKPKSNKITKMDRPGQRGHQYIAFRTVSSNSHPASWVINRHKATRESMTEEIRRIIQDVHNQAFR